MSQCVTRSYCTEQEKTCLLGISKSRNVLNRFQWHNLRFRLCPILEYWTLLFLHIRVHILPCQQNDMTLKQHPSTYTLLDIVKRPGSCWEARERGKELGQAYIVRSTPVLSFGNTFSCFFINRGHYMLPPAPSSTSHFSQLFFHLWMPWLSRNVLSWRMQPVPPWFAYVSQCFAGTLSLPKDALIPKSPDQPSHGSIWSGQRPVFVVWSIFGEHA